MLKDEVVVSAPGKLMLLGEHAVVYNYPCLVTAVDSRIRVTVRQRSDGHLVIDAPQLQQQPYRKPLSQLADSNEQFPKEVAFVRKTIEKVILAERLKRGITVSTKSDFSHRYGFGSSSAVTVATLKALSELYGFGWSKKKIFDLAYQIVLAIQGVGSGFDIAAAVYGGTLYFITGGKEIVQITPKPIPLLVGYSGIKADTPTLVKKVRKLLRKQPAMVKDVFAAMAVLVEKGKKHLQQEEWNLLGNLFRVNQGLLWRLGVSTPCLDQMCTQAVLSGAYGAKLSGAGGGDCMIALVTAKKRSAVEKAIEAVGGKVIPVATGAEGVRIEKSN